MIGYGSDDDAYSPKNLTCFLAILDSEPNNMSNNLQYNNIFNIGIV